MKNTFLLLLLFTLSFASKAQAPKDSVKSDARIILVPYQSMMYFSDADPDMARFSKLDEGRLRNELRNAVEQKTYHALLASFDVVSLLRASALEGEKDLNRMYAATRYAMYSKQQKEAYQKERGAEETPGVRNLMQKFARKSKDQTFWISDSTVMLAMMGDKELFNYLNKKYNEQYILVISQFEISTSNKNMIEWQKQQYTREYTMHYNLFDKTGNLIRAEALTIKAGGENNLKDISEKYLPVLAQRLKEIIVASNK